MNEPNEVKMRREAQRGSQAETILNNELLTEAFATIEDAYFDAWKKSPSDAVASRERLWQAAAIIGLVRENLKEVIRTGKVAAKHLSQIEATPSPNRD